MGRKRTAAGLALAVALPSVGFLACFPTLREIPGTGGSTSASSSSASTSSTGGSASSTSSTASSSSTGSSSSSSSTGAGGATSSSSTTSSSSSGTGGSCGDTTSSAQNCGRCGHGCCGGKCVDSVCQPFVISQGNYPGPPVVDDTFIYWPDATNTSAGNILKAPKTGGQAIILASGQDQPSAVAVDANNVYWVNDVNNPPVDIGGVFSAPLTGAGPVSTLATNQAYPNFLVVNGTSIFWGDHGSNGIERAALDGGQETQVSVANAPLGLALDGQFVYWADHGSGKILKAPLFGSGTVTIANGTSPVAVAINATTIVWANYSEGTIQSAPIAGVNATAATIATSNGRGPNSIVVDDTYVYWGDQGPPAGIGFDGGVGPDGGPNGAILYAPLSGTGALGTILAESANPLWITSDQSCIYWADGGKIGNGNISVVAKP